MTSLEALHHTLASLESDAAALAQEYRRVLGEHLPSYILQEVRGACTQEAAGQFLQLPELAQQRIVHLTHHLAQSLSQALLTHPWTTSLEQVSGIVEPYLQASERQLNQMLALEQLGPLTLKFFAAELGSPALRTLRAQWQVTQSRRAAIHRQISRLEAKNQVAAAQARWDQLQTS